MRDISSGELILHETPLFTQPRSRSNSTILTALASLTEKEQREYFSLCNCHRGKQPPALGTFNTNVLPCGDNEVSRGAFADEGGIFILGSRFNSSCIPNINNYWDPQMQQITFRALRDIALGEELCISYTDLLCPREDRQRYLKDKFGFVCTCDACSRVGADLKASDERRSTISRLYGELAGCGSNPELGIRKVNRFRIVDELALILSNIRSNMPYDCWLRKVS